MALWAAISTIGLLLSTWMLFWWSRRARELAERADALRAGAGPAEISTRAFGDLNRLARSITALGETLSAARRSSERLESEFSALMPLLSEGVLLVGCDRRVTGINRAACRYLQVDARDAVGELLVEVIRSSELNRVIDDVLATGTSSEAELELFGERTRIAEATGNPVRSKDGAITGVAVVLHDVTQIRRLESVRQDFVANVSHELKTPITTIKGYAETLLDGACEETETARRFLTILVKQSDRLEAIVNDLLTLARLEAKPDRSPIGMSRANLAALIEESIEVVQAKADALGVTVECRVPAGIDVEVNVPLMEQALVNLIDNACKYSEPGAAVVVDAVDDGGRVSIRVRDEGCGIEARHLSRLFERFYRVDASRSRQLGGTGLGLAIVKHIVQLHHGDVAVESIPGKGSTFTVSLARAAAEG